jgi:hypothetical protein
MLGSPFDWPIFGRNGLLLPVVSARAAAALRTGRLLGGVSGVQAPLSGEPILYSGMALTAASTPSFRIVGRRARAEAPRGSGEARHGSRQTRLPIEAIEKTLDVLVVERQRLHEQRSGPSRLKQIDGRSCTGNANLLKLGGRPARPLRGFATA